MNVIAIMRAELLRLGTFLRPARKRFKVQARPLGVYPGLDYDNIGKLIEYAEGPLHK